MSCLVAVLALGPRARAAGVAVPEETEQAEAAYAQAQQAFDAGDCRKALPAFARAYRLKSHPRALLHIGHCYRKLDDLDSAAEAYTLLIERYEASPLARRARDLLIVIESERTRPGKQVKSAPAPGVPRFSELALDAPGPSAPGPETKVLPAKTVAVSPPQPTPPPAAATPETKALPAKAATAPPPQPTPPPAVAVKTAEPVPREAVETTHPPPEKSGGGSSWGWWVGGGVVAAGAAVAILFLVSSSKSVSEPTGAYHVP